MRARIFCSVKQEINYFVCKTRSQKYEKLYMFAHCIHFRTEHEFLKTKTRCLEENEEKHERILENSVIFEFFSVIFAQILMKFYRNFANILENVKILIF